VQRLHGDIPEHMLNLEEPVMMNTVGVGAQPDIHRVDP
jgi:hypothetical protein